MSFVNSRILVAAALVGTVLSCSPVRADLVTVTQSSTGWSLNDWELSLGSSYPDKDVLLVPTGITANPNFYNEEYNYGDNYHGQSGNPNESPTYTTASGFTYWYNYEDDTDNTLGPHTGGQDFDGEFLGVGISGLYLAVAIVTGQTPDNPFANYAPGDLRIETSSGSFGVELTGYTFTLNESGYTTSAKNSSGTTYKSGGSTFDDKTRTSNKGEAKPFAAGTFVSDAQWKSPPDSLQPATPVQLIGGDNSKSLSVQMYYSDDNLKYKNGSSYTSSHAIYEILIPLSYFGAATIESVHWAPSCGNDLLDVNMNVNHMPEPGSLALAGFAGIGLALRALRRRRTQKSDQTA